MIIPQSQENLYSFWLYERIQRAGYNGDMSYGIFDGEWEFP